MNGLLLILLSYLIASLFFFNSLNVHKIMSVFFYVWPILLEKTLGGRNIEDGVFNFFFCRIFSQEIPSDVTIHVGGASFSLHKVLSNLNSPKFQFQVSDYLIESMTGNKT